MNAKERAHIWELCGLFLEYVALVIVIIMAAAKSLQPMFIPP